jgi:hydrogenase nickel incorporation protein HypA/HybF
MHELSVILSIVDCVQNEVIKQGAKKVNRIELDIGNMVSIDWNCFEFAWEPGVRNTVLEHAKRIVNKIPSIAVCADCAHTFKKKSLYDACPECGKYVHELKSGKELKIKSLLIA